HIKSNCGGVATNFRMPDIMSIGLGGGSIVRQQQDGSVTVGPDSVGYKITDEALTFGGNIITATDIAVRLGLSEIGDPQLTKQIPLKFAQAALETIGDMIAVAIDKMKTSAEPA
ncbi:hydantoinase/oxoprolinase family protein, partial [Streptococcus thermophilus]|nr:hydantoinase/oxoprolinase family protein [Streptococcus thermophilus]